MCGRLALVLTVNILHLGLPSFYIKVDAVHSANFKTWIENFRHCALYLYSWNKSGYSSENVHQTSVSDPDPGWIQIRVGYGFKWSPGSGSGSRFNIRIRIRIQEVKLSFFETESKINIIFH